MVTVEQHDEEPISLERAYQNLQELLNKALPAGMEVHFGKAPRGKKTATMLSVRARSASLRISDVTIAQELESIHKLAQASGIPVSVDYHFGNVLVPSRHISDGAMQQDVMIDLIALYLKKEAPVRCIPTEHIDGTISAVREALAQERGKGHDPL